MSKFINVTLYDAELYDKGKPFKSSKLVNVDGKTDDEITQLVNDIKNRQKIKNETFREMKPVARNGRPPKIRGEISNLPIKFDEKTGNTFVLFGASKSGKSTLMMKLYHDQWNYPLKSTLTTLFAMNSQIPIYDDKWIIKCDRFDNRCADYIDWQRKTNKLNENKFIFLNMFDDIIDVRHKSILNNLLLTYRNSNMSAMICLQYVNLLSKAARSNVNNVFLMHMNTDESIDVAVRAYLAALLRKIGISMDNSVQWYRDNTRDHNFVYINPSHGIAWISATRELYQL
jgi:hypothetical protein